MTNPCFPLRSAFLLLLMLSQFSFFLLSSTSKLTVLIYDVREYDIYIMSFLSHDRRVRTDIKMNNYHEA